MNRRGRRGRRGREGSAKNQENNLLVTSKRFHNQNALNNLSTFQPFNFSSKNRFQHPFIPRYIIRDRFDPAAGGEAVVQLGRVGPVETVDVLNGVA